MRIFKLLKFLVNFDLENGVQFGLSKSSIFQSKKLLSKVVNAPELQTQMISSNIARKSLGKSLSIRLILLAPFEDFTESTYRFI